MPGQSRRRAFSFRSTRPMSCNALRHLTEVWTTARPRSVRKRTLRPFGVQTGPDACPAACVRGARSVPKRSLQMRTFHDPGRACRIRSGSRRTTFRPGRSVRCRTDTTAISLDAPFAPVRSPAAFLTVPNRFWKGLAARIARGGAHRKELEMRGHFERSACVPMCAGGMAVCMLAVLGIVAIMQSIPASYASVPDEGAWTGYRAAPGQSKETRSHDPQTNVAVSSATVNHRKPACPECGVIESMRQIDRAGDGGGKNTVAARVTGRVSAGASASAAHVVAEKGYEITVRFRDGSTTVFSEATPRAWRSGGRVIVIAGSYASND